MAVGDTPPSSERPVFPSRVRDEALGPMTEQFNCAPYIGRSAVDAVPSQPHVINASYFHGPITEAIYFGATAVSKANAAMEGLHRLIRDRSANRIIALETGLGEEWNTQPVQALRTAIFAIAGSQFVRPDQPTQAVRNDVLAGEPNGTIIVKGWADKLPLFIVEKEIQPGVRRIDVLNGQITEMDGVMHEVNAFSPKEHRLAGAYLSARTSDRGVKQAVMRFANRYTTPDPDTLHGAFQFELSQLRETVMPSAWQDAMARYSKRKGEIPENSAK